MTKFQLEELVKEQRQNVISPDELAKMFGVSMVAVSMWATRGKNGKILAKTKIGKRVFFHPDDVAEFHGLVAVKTKTELVRQQTGTG